MLKSGPIHQIHSFLTATVWRATVSRFLVAMFASIVMAMVVPFFAGSDLAILFVFVVLIGCSWYLGVGPAIVLPWMLLVALHIRAHGTSGAFLFSAKEILDFSVITGFTTAVGASGVLRRRFEVLAESRARQLQEQDRRKDEFLATLAHELRNPLAPIRTGLEVLRLAFDRSQDATFRDVSQMMQRQVDHMVRLIEDLLDVSRINTGKIDIRRERVALAALISDAAESSRPLIDSARHTLSVAVPEEPVFLSGDRARLTQVLMNLLNNATKFTEPGGRIWLEAKGCDGNFIEIRVRDTGIGMTAETLPHIFEMFTQAENILTRSYGGLGIGLNLVRTIVELHGGSVQAFSPGLGLGSEIVVRLPRGGQDPSPAVTRAVSVAEVKSRRILVVDDNRDAARSLAMILKMQGHVCETAFEGKAGLQVAAQFRPDVFLLDIGMPEMSGFEMAASLRSTSEFKSSFLIAVTGWGQDYDRTRCLEAGFDYHLVKPVKSEEIKRVLDTLGQPGQNVPEARTEIASSSN